MGTQQSVQSRRSLQRLLFILLAVPGIPACAEQAAAEGPARTYELVYSLELHAGDDVALAGIRTGRDARRFREMRFHARPDRYFDFEADGALAIRDGEIVWNPPRSGGSLRYRVRVPHQRKSGGYDAFVTDHWALFRGDDVFPSAVTRALVGSRSDARLELGLPKGWSAVTPYLSGDDGTTFDIANPQRRFDRPTGWILAGELGVRRGRIADRRVAIAAPLDQGLRRMDIMAFLRWTLPGVVNVFPSMDSRLVIVGAGDPMWRGGLSGPGSMFIHADRPLISENGTSTLLHELVHVAMAAAGSEHDDWLVEGLAEYYSIKILHTSGTMSARRRHLSLAELADWGANVDDLFVRNSSGEITARATTLLAALDHWLLQQTAAAGGLDAVVAKLIDNGGRYNYRELCIATRQILGAPVPMLDPSQVPGAPDLPECRATTG